jgi:4-hydroxy-tetrahydrodipicolinate synthase
MDSLKGVGVALITPFKDSGRIDYNSLEQVLAHTTNGNIDYYVVMGTTAEASTIFHQEKMDILRFVKKNNSRNLPIIYGLGGNCTASIVDKFRAMDEEVDAFLSVSPAYNKPSQLGITKHYEALADAAKAPIILYNVPGRTSSNISAETTLTLANHPNIIGIKEASGSLEQCKEIARKKPENFMLISGDDMQTFDMIKAGASGIISVIANALPEEFSSMVHEALDGNEPNDSDKKRMQQFDDLIMGECNPSGVKSALKHLGLCSDDMRLPLTPVTAELDLKIKAFIDNQ